jgi:outer membrane protein assembly factor BamB
VRLLHAWLFAVAACQAFAEDDLNWPEFRGPRGDGVTTSTGLPTEWSETNHVRWKAAIPGRAWASPVVWDGSVWLATATPDGRELSILRVDKESGAATLSKKLFDVAKPQFAHEFNSYASPTPALAEGRVFVSFGSPGTACLDMATGEILWARRDLECNHYRGAGSSPVLADGKVFLNFDGSDHQFVVALDQKTGKTVWRVERSVDYADLGSDGQPSDHGDWRKSFATCRVGEFDGVRQLVSQGAKAVYGYSPDTGAELWRVEEKTSHSAGTRPAFYGGLVFVPSGWSQGTVMAIHPGKGGEALNIAGEATSNGSLALAWRAKKGVPKKPSLTVANGLLFGIDDNGVATCWEPATGAVVWNERIGGNYSASPLAGDGRLYFFSEEGKVSIVAADRKFQRIAENQLPDGFMASPAVSGKALYLRTRTSLYRVEN